MELLMRYDMCKTTLETQTNTYRIYISSHLILNWHKSQKKTDYKIKRASTGTKDIILCDDENGVLEMLFSCENIGHVRPV